MVRSGNNGAVRTPGPATSSRDRDIYQRYATGLYRQAFLTLGDAALAEHVVRDVIVDECALGPGYGEGDTPGRLAGSVFLRCQELAADPAGRLPAPRLPADAAGGVDPGGLLSAKERGALGLVLIGGLGYERASSVLGIRPRDMAALLRTALLRLGTSPDAAAGDGSQVTPGMSRIVGSAEEQEESDEGTRVRRRGRHGSRRSRARGTGGQVAARRAAVPGDEKDVTTSSTRAPVSLLARSGPPGGGRRDRPAVAARGR
jgi:hypothetical protein